MKNDHSCLGTAGLHPNIDHGGTGGAYRTYLVLFSEMVVFHAVPGEGFSYFYIWLWAVVVAVVAMDVVFVVIVFDVVAR